MKSKKKHLNLNLPNQEELFFKPPISIESSWLIGRTSLEVNISIFEITRENNKFEVYLFPESEIDGISFKKIRDEIEKDVEISDTKAADIQDEIGPTFIEEYREKVSKRMEDGGYMKNLAGYTRSIVEDFESYVLC